MASAFTPPTEYPFGVHLPTATDKHLAVLTNDYLRRNALGPPLTARERERFAALLAEQDVRRAAKALPRRLDAAGPTG